MQDQPLIIRLTDAGPPEVVNPEVLGNRSVIVIPDGDIITIPADAFLGMFALDNDRPMAETLADAEPDPLRAWMLSYPGHAEVEPPESGAGPGWGDESDVENARSCPWCRGSLTDHNREVHAAGYSLGERHSIEDLQRLATDTVMNAARDPWASDGAGYDVRVLRAGIQAIASDALVREDFGTAAYAYSVLAGQPIAPQPVPWTPEDGDRRCQECGSDNIVWFTDSDLWNRVAPNDGVLCVPCFVRQAEDAGETPPAWHLAPERRDVEHEPSAEDRAPRVYMASAQTILVQAPLPEAGLLVLPGDGPTDEPVNATTPEGDEPCGAAAYGVRFAACDLPAGHNSQHHAWYDAGHGPTTILWENLR